MSDLIKLFEQSPQVSAALNLLACLVAAAWTVGLAGRQRDDFRLARTGWVAFWVATAASYLAQTIHQALPGAQLGYFVATAALLATWDPHHRKHRWPSRAWVLASCAIVASCVLVDFLVARHRSSHEELGAHQLLTAAAIGLWAWRAREVDVSGSMVIVGYALAQLPVHQTLTLLNVPTEVTYDDFIAKTYALYAVLKLALCAAVCSMLASKRDP